MQDGEIYLVFTEPLEAIGLRYMVTGSVASSSYGEPRFTHDIDLMLSLPAGAVDRLWQAFPAVEFYCPPVDALKAEARRSHGGHFNLVHHESGFRADVYLTATDELTSWAFEKSRVIEVVPGRQLRLAPPEYVILGKLQFYSEGGGERHIRDARAMIEVAGDQIDTSLIESWAHRLGVDAAWIEVKESSD